MRTREREEKATGSELFFFWTNEIIECLMGLLSSWLAVVVKVGCWCWVLLVVLVVVESQAEAVEGTRDADRIPGQAASAHSAELVDDDVGVIGRIGGVSWRLEA
jgi:hypothetical protein